MKIPKKAKNIMVYLKKGIKNRNIFVFLFFLLLSAFLWFLDALNKEYYSNVYIPLKIENIPIELELKEDEVHELEVNIFGHGYSLLKRTFERMRMPLIIDFNSRSNPAILHQSFKNTDEYFILTNNLVNTISKRFGDNVQITSIYPDTVYFHRAEKKISKKLRVVPVIEYKIHNDYMLNGKPEIDFDSIIVTGNELIIDTMTIVPTKNTNLGEIHDNNKRILDIETYKNLIYSQEKITITFPIEKYTEITKELEIKKINFPGDINSVLIPNKVQISYKIPLSLYDKIDENNFEVFVDYEKRKNDIIPIDTRSINNVIVITKINPIYTKYVLEKNDIDD